MNALAPQIPLNIPAKLLPVLKPKRFKILHGGRGGAKSHTVAQLLLALGLQQTLRILCVREVQKSLDQSSMQVLKDYIDRLNLHAYYEILKTEIRSRINGTTFHFTGLQEHTAESLKSYESVDIVWCEEAHSITAKSFGILIPTIRKETGGPFGTGSEIWCTFNPDQEDDYVYDRFVVHTDEDALVIEVNWRDNPWFGQIMDKERLKLKALNDDLYQHVWEGKCASLGGVMFKRRMFKYWDVLPETLGRAYMAGDYAGAPDPDNPHADPDNTEFGAARLDIASNLYFVDWWADATDADVWIPAASHMAKTQDALIWYEEKGVILRALDSAITRAMSKAGCRTYRHAIPSASSKAERALGFLALVQQGKVYFPNPAKPGNEWVTRVINQLCAFTGQPGKKDDAVDVCSLLARGLDLMIAPPEPRDDKPKAVVPFSKQHIEAVDYDEDERERQRARYYR